MPVSVGLIAQTIEKIAPKAWAEEWDNVGLLVGDFAAPVERILVTLDATPEVLQEAREKDVQLIIAHHPILFRALKNLRSDNQGARLPIQMIQSGIAYYAAHTNLDQSSLSSSWSLGRALELEKMEHFKISHTEKLVKLVAFIPKDHAEEVRQALVKAGVGEGITDGPHASEYAECFFAGEGTGMFRPLGEAQPIIGEIGELTRVEEIRLESIIPEHRIDRVVKALKKAHPYEEPAYDLIPLYNTGASRGYGIMGYLKEPESLGSFSLKLPTNLKKLAPISLAEEPTVRISGSPEQILRKIAIVNGSGGSFISKALFKGVDLLITGDVGHHEALDALEAGLSIMDMGHFWGEIPMVKALAEYLKGEKALAEVEVIISEKMKNPWRTLNT
ncbi:Nif3-like dinuclear metal center hexameric protein [Desulfitobacterium sp. PCE1]|uniref:Nif3-like dinuclear metal center hexameric protein n=1 Tax=Desulfitobacterium sp. PCE1 TaxID=146907 RepID=UPI000378C6F2|nr:Nif3-like dinuclear metal center hexameric protein [Desulfitobacterium sp. PCE1]